MRRSAIGWIRAVAPVVAVAALICVAVSCSLSDFVDGTSVGRVIDQDTGAPIPGAIVVGRYEGLANGSQACNRIESAVSDANGTFEFPLDENTGALIVAGYHRNYVRGNSTRHAMQTDPANYKKWQVVIVKWDETNSNATIISTEPTIYGSEKTALSASGEFRDVYLKRVQLTRENRLKELELWQTEANCYRSSKVSPGAVPFFQAILQEQLQLGAPASHIERTQEHIEMGLGALARSKQ
jgi:hypothetical protein